MSELTVLQEMGRLHLTCPCAGAPAAVEADWYERKGELWEFLAGEGYPDAAALAEQSYQHADDLRAVAA